MSKLDVAWKGVLSWALGLSCLLLPQSGSAQTCHYELDVTVEPDLGQLEVETRIVVPASLVEGRQVTFFLNPEFDVKGATLDGAEVHARRARKLRELPFRGALAEYGVRVRAGSDEVVLGLRYGGPLPGENRGFGGIDEHLVELALYRTWFPHIAGVTGLTHELSVDLPAGWQVATNGSPVEAPAEAGGRVAHRFATTGPPVVDINVVASDRFQRARVEQDGWQVDALFVGLDPAQGAVMARVAADALALFTREWGAAAEPGRVTVAAVPRKGQSYSRLPLMVLNEEMLGRELEVDPGGCGSTGIAHEVGHIWWNRGDFLTAEDWLNEALAEFARLRFVEARCGVERLRSEQSDSLRQALGFEGEVIAGTLRTDRGAYALYYERGSRLFTMLEDRIGRAAVQRALATFLAKHEPRTATTDDLVAAFDQAAGFDLEPFLDHWYRGDTGPLLLVDAVQQEEGAVRVDLGLEPADRGPITVEVEVVTDRGVVRERVEVTEARSSHRIPIAGQVLEAHVNRDGRALVRTWDTERADLYWDLAGNLGMKSVTEDLSWMTAQRLADGRAVIDRLYARDPSDDIAQLWEARWLFFQQRIEEASVLMEEVLAQEVIDLGSSGTSEGRARARAYVQLELGRLYDLLGRREEAIALYRQVEPVDSRMLSRDAAAFVEAPYTWPGDSSEEQVRPDDDQTEEEQP